MISKLPGSQTNQIVSKQITRSVTSIGANSEEADGSNTKKDFIHCFTIARKESKETAYWLRLLNELNPQYSNELNILIRGAKEISAIITTIIKRTFCVIG